MNLNSENKQAIHDLLITDMQKRLYESVNEDLTHKNKRVVPFEDYTTALEVLVDEILLTQSLNDIRTLLFRYDYFLFHFVYTYFMFVWPHVSSFSKN